MKTLLILGKGEYANFYLKHCAKNYPDLELIFASHEDANFSGFEASHINLPLGREFEAIIEHFKSKGITPAGILNRLDQYEPLHAQLVEHYDLAGPSFSAIDMLSNKIHLDDVMKKAHLEQHRPETTTCVVEDLEAVLHSVTLPVVVKPNMGAKSRGVCFVKNEDDIDEALRVIRRHYKRLRKKSEAEITDEYVAVESFLEGFEVSCESFVDDKGTHHFLALTDIVNAKRTGQPHMQHVYRTMPSKQSKEVENTIRHIIDEIIRVSGIRSTCLHIEFMVQGSDVRLIEVNVRIGGYRRDLLRYVYGVDMNAIALKLALGEDVGNVELDDRNVSATTCEVWDVRTGVVQKLELPENSKIVSHKYHIMVGDTYTAPPQENKMLATFTVVTEGDVSLEIAKDIRANTIIDIV